MQDTELVVTATLYLASEDFYTSTKISNPASAGTRVLVCGQNIIRTYFLLLLNPARRRRDGVKEEYYV
jgi:hypothetical protein